MRSVGLLAATVAVLLAGCNTTPARTDQPAPSYLAALRRPSVINPTIATTAILERSSAGERLAIFAKMLDRAEARGCRPVRDRMTERAQDGRSLWTVWCQDGAKGKNGDYIFTIPAKAETFAQILRCRPVPDGGAQCSSF